MMNLRNSEIINNLMTLTFLNIFCHPTHTHTHRGILFYLTIHTSLHSDQSARWQSAQCLPLFQSAASQGLCILVQCIAVNIKFLLATFKEATGNVFLRLTDTCHIYQTCCLMDVKVV